MLFCAMPQTIQMPMPPLSEKARRRAERMRKERLNTILTDPEKTKAQFEKSRQLRLSGKLS